MDWIYLYTSLQGRINRKPFWIGTFVLFCLGLSLELLVQNLAGEAISVFVALAFFVPGYAVDVKRAHDRNRPDWLIAMFYIPVAIFLLLDTFWLDVDNWESLGLHFSLLFIVAFGIALTIDLGFMPGTAGPNAYGPNPLEGLA